MDLFNRISKHIQGSTIIQRAEFADAMALMILQAAAARAQIFTQIPFSRQCDAFPRLYMLLVGESSSGKSQALSVAKEILIGIDALGASSMRSSQGMAKAWSDGVSPFKKDKKGTFLDPVDTWKTRNHFKADLIDECGKLIASMGNDRAPVYMQAMGDALNRQYSAAATRFDKGSLAQDGETGSRYVHHLSRCIVGTTTIEGATRAMTPSNIESGLIGRFLVFVARGHVPPNFEAEVNRAVERKQIISDLNRIIENFIQSYPFAKRPHLYKWHNVAPQDRATGKQILNLYRDISIQTHKKAKETSHPVLWAKALENITAASLGFYLGRCSADTIPPFSITDVRVAHDFVSNSLGSVEELAAAAREGPQSQIERETIHLLDKMLKRARVTGRGPNRQLSCYETSIKRETARMRRRPYGNKTYYKAIIDLLCGDGTITVKKGDKGDVFIFSQEFLEAFDKQEKGP